MPTPRLTIELGRSISSMALRTVGDRFVNDQMFTASLAAAALLCCRCRCCKQRCGQRHQQRTGARCPPMCDDPPLVNWQRRDAVERRANLSAAARKTGNKGVGGCASMRAAAQKCGPSKCACCRAQHCRRDVAAEGRASGRAAAPRSLRLPHLAAVCGGAPTPAEQPCHSASPQAAVVAGLPKALPVQLWRCDDDSVHQRPGQVHRARRQRAALHNALHLRSDGCRVKRTTTKRQSCASARGS